MRREPPRIRRRADPASSGRHRSGHGPSPRRTRRGDATSGPGTGRARNRAEPDLGSPARHRARRAARQRTLDQAVATVAAIGNAGTSTTNTCPSARKAQSGASKRSTKRRSRWAALDRASRLSYASGGRHPSPPLSMSVSSRPEDRSYETQNRNHSVTLGGSRCASA